MSEISVVALTAQIFFCPVGAPSELTGLCHDGAPRMEMTMNVLAHSDRGDALIEFVRGGKVELLVRPDGSVSNPGGEKVDDAARVFWLAISKAYPEFCTWALENAK